MGTWNSRGLRGSTLEDMINHSNEVYREKKLALIQKIPTPITPITIEKSTRHITLAYFDQKSTVDYIGAVQGIPVCFDAKECAVKTFPSHFVIWKPSGNGCRTGAARASPTMRSIKAIRSAPAGIFWCIIWRRYKKTSQNEIPHNKNLRAISI